MKESNGELSKSKLYIDLDNTLKTRKDIIKQFNSINKSLSKISGILNKMLYKKVIKKDSKKVAELSNKCSLLAEESLKLMNDFDYKFDSDMKDYSIKILDSRISDLENKLSKLINEK